MTRSKRRVRLPVVVGTFIMALASLPALASPHDHLSQLQHRQDSVHSHIAHLTQRHKGVAARVKHLDARRAAADRQVKDLDARLAALDDRLHHLQAQLATARKQIGKLHAHLLDVQAHLVHRTDVFDRRARAIYEAGPSAMMDGLLTSKNFGDLMDRYTYYQAAIVGDRDLLDQITGLRDDMQHRQGELAAQQKQLSKAKEKLTSTRDSVLAARNERRKVAEQRDQAVADKQALLRKIESSKAASQKAAEELDSEVQRVQGIIAAAQAAAAAKAAQAPAVPQTPSVAAPSTPQPPSSTTTSGGQLSWPASGPITSTFGMRVDPVTGVYQLHTGIDIAAGYGATVTAADDGTIIYAGTMTGYGNVVVIDHGGGLSTLYGHLSAYSVTVGQVVARGAPIANVGCTGYCTGPHLHFEVRINGTPTDPLPYLE